VYFIEPRKLLVSSLAQLEGTFGDTAFTILISKQKEQYGMLNENN